MVYNEYIKIQAFLESLKKYANIDIYNTTYEKK